MTSALDILGDELPFTPRQLFEASDRLRQSGMMTADLWMAVKVLEHVANRMLLPPLDDVMIKALVRAASAGGVLTRGANTSQRIVKNVEKYYGVDATEPMCPMCSKPISDPPCSASSDGAFHTDHPHNPGRQSRIFR
jgi:hypothetical protein